MEDQIPMEHADAARSQPPRPSSAPGETVIAEDMTVGGDFQGSGTLWVEGLIEGSAEVTGVVVVAEGGAVKGSIRADEVYVAGRVEGDIFAGDLLRLEMTGEINGDVTAAAVQIEDGGCMNGLCTMTETGREPVFLYE